MWGLVSKSCWVMFVVVLGLEICGCSKSGGVVRPAPRPMDCLNERAAAPVADLVISPDIDPHGQGSDLLGLGIVRGAMFARVDRFDVQKITDANHNPIVEVAVDSYGLTGKIDRGLMKRARAADFDHAILTGQLHCPKAAQREDIVVRVRGTVSRIIGGVTVQTYQLELEDHGRWVNACRDAGDVAFPIRGYWADDGRYMHDRRYFSFACTKRDVATCLSEGYGEDRDSRALLEACTRMMRADYCGDGKSYTKDGSFVTMWDNNKRATQPPLLPLDFEAAWNDAGAACIHRPRWTESDLGRAPDCLAQLPQCATEDAARRLFAEFPKQALLFNHSCESHPCRVTRVEFDEERVQRTAVVKWH